MNKQATESTISFNAPLDVKARLQRMANDNGLTLSTLIRMSLVQVLNKGVRIDPTLEPSAYLVDAIKQAEGDVAAGKTTTVSNESELLAHLKDLKN